MPVLFQAQLLYIKGKIMSWNWVNLRGTSRKRWLKTSQRTGLRHYFYKFYSGIFICIQTRFLLTTVAFEIYFMLAACSLTSTEHILLAADVSGPPAPFTTSIITSTNNRINKSTRASATVITEFDSLCNKRFKTHFGLHNLKSLYSSVTNC